VPVVIACGAVLVFVSNSEIQHVIVRGLMVTPKVAVAQERAAWSRLRSFRICSGMPVQVVHPRPLLWRQEYVEFGFTVLKRAEEAVA